MIGAALTATAGSSRYFRGGVIAYDNEVKQRILGVPPVTLSRHGAVSAQTVTAMAAGVAALLGTECAIAVSGIAGPGGGTAEKPVGLVYIGIHYCGRTQAFRHLFDGDREVVRERAVMEGLNELMRVMR
jgi:PncC family amidohydrolase